jgi:putative NADH-flavin reductase
MKVAVIGGSGRQGSRLITELLARGHEVTAIARNPEKIEARKGVTAKKGDLAHPASVAPLLKGHDAIINAVRFHGTDARHLLEAVKKSGVKRLLVVGGAGGLEVAPGVMLITTPQFPEVAKPEATAGLEFLRVIRGEQEIDWVFLSPGALLAPGERTGKYRLGKDQLLKDESGKSWISMEDFAIAMIDELEAPKHSRTRFHAAY